MGNNLAGGFCWADSEKVKAEGLTAEEKYQELIRWAERARGTNPNAFDAVTEWLLEDSEWSSEKLAANEKLLMQDVIARFQEQNVWLREWLESLREAGVVNLPVFGALDRFEEELSGKTHEKLRDAVSWMFSDFSVMADRNVRVQIAGSKTGPTGTDSVELFGYINFLKDCDAAVQWALFMPEMVKRQQNGFHVESFLYRKLPAMRFIGQEGEHLESVEERRKLFSVLDAMKEYHSELQEDVLFIHHYGQGVDVNPGHAFWGRFMAAGAPAPEGFAAFEFVPEWQGGAGVPYISQFAYAVFAGDEEAMHQREGFDSDAMYDVTRNIMLAQGVNIPYPDKYWVAEVFPDGHEKNSSAYMFSAELSL